MDANMVWNNCWIQMRQAAEEKWMLETLHACESHVVLPKPHHTETHFCIEFGEVGKACFGVGIYSVGIFSPNIILWEDPDRVAIGYNSNLCLLDIKKRQVLFDIPLKSIFYYGQCLNGALVVVAEYIAYVIRMDGSIIKEAVLDDVIESFHFDGPVLVCKTASGTVSSVDCGSLL